MLATCSAQGEDSQLEIWLNLSTVRDSEVLMVNRAACLLLREVPCIVIIPVIVRGNASCSNWPFSVMHVRLQECYEILGAGVSEPVTIPQLCKDVQSGT